MINKKILINLCLVAIEASSMEYTPTESDLRSKLATAQAQLAGAKDMYERHAIRNEIRDILALIYPKQHPDYPYALYPTVSKPQLTKPVTSGITKPSKFQLLKQSILGK